MDTENDKLNVIILLPTLHNDFYFYNFYDLV